MLRRIFSRSLGTQRLTFPVVHFMRRLRLLVVSDRLPRRDVRLRYLGDAEIHLLCPIKSKVAYFRLTIQVKDRFDILLKNFEVVTPKNYVDSQG